MKEPNWGVNVLNYMNSWMYKHQILHNLVPIFADIFVFSYPIYLVALYLYGIKQKKDYYKNLSLLLFFASFGSILVNSIIQFMIIKVRPDILLDLFLEKRSGLLLDNLPEDTFPSDHAALSMSIAIVTLMWGFKHKDKFFVRLSIVFIVFSIIMGLCRITVGIHWPTDIMVGFFVGLLISLVLFNKKILNFLQKIVFKFIIRIQERIWKKIFG